MCIQPPLQSSQKVHSSTLANFHLPIPLLLTHKTILTIPTTLPFSISEKYFTSLVLRTAIPTIYTKSISLPQPFSQGTNEQESHVRTDTVFISPFFLEGWRVKTEFTITDSLSLRHRKLLIARSSLWYYHRNNSHFPENHSLSLIFIINVQRTDILFMPFSNHSL